MGFAESLSVASVGEFVVWDYFSHHKGIKEILDVRDDKKFQQYDVDFLIMDSNRQVAWVEVKTDFKAHETGNFVYEISTSGNIGCFEKTLADVIAYYVPSSGNLYLLDVKALREYTKTRTLREVRMGDNAKGYLLDIGDLERTKVILLKTEVRQWY